MNKKIFITAGVAALLNALSAQAADKYYTKGDNYSYEFTVYNEGEDFVIGGKQFLSPFTLEKRYLTALDTAAKKWAGVLETSSLPQPTAGYYIFSEDEYNASAMSPYVSIKESPYKVTFINAMINSRQVIDDDDDDDDEDLPEDLNGFIQIGYGTDEDFPGWQGYSGLHSLLHDQPKPDMHTVLLHEIMHSLGIITDVSQQREEDAETYYFTESDDDSLAVFDKDLRIYTGTDPEEFDFDNEIVPTAKMAVGEDRDFDVFAYAPYYVGETTLKVLSGEDNYYNARVKIIENGGLTNYSVSYDDEGEYPQVFGMPIHNADNDEVDLSHLELRNSFMSHQSFRNWLVPMEAELAVLKDIGYNVDLRKYFGKSYYLNNQTADFAGGYSEWDGSSYTGNPSTVAQGVGLHIYGNNNKITQSANIATVGEGSFGVRIDGVGNNYSLLGGSSIETNGKENLGIAVTWGKDHIINIKKGSSVEAAGEDGIAVAFDFGDNLFGSQSDARGSYIRYKETFLGYLSISPSAETDSALVKQFNVAGTITGNQAAIYIADNAHVKQINISDGAQINGDIVSAWNSVQSGKNAKVKWKNSEDDSWYNVDIRDKSQRYFTDINIKNNFNGTINGSIIGDTTVDDNIFNTLKLNNKGNVTVTETQIAVYSLLNAGSINVNNAEISVLDGSITGKGELNVANSLQLNNSVEQIDNVINLKKNATFSTLDGEINELEISRLNADNAYISFDLGDKYTLATASQNDTAAISQIKLNEENIDTLDDNAAYELFGNTDNVLNLGDSYANLYHDGKKYQIAQDTEHKNLLRAKVTGENAYLPDAAGDETTANYIVKEDKQIKNIGTVYGNDFEISGNDIDVNGYEGMIVDGSSNKNGTILKTGIFGAKDNDISVINGGKFAVISQDKDIILGEQSETAIYLENAEAKLNAENYAIDVNGAIKGAAGGKNIVKINGDAVSLHEVDDANIVAREAIVNLNAAAHNTVWEIDTGELNVSDDAFLSADGSNEIIGTDSKINLINGKASAIEFNKMSLNNDITLNIDIDLATASADHFVVSDEKNLITDNVLLNIENINLLNQSAILTDPEIAINFIDKAFGNTGLLKSVNAGNNLLINTPIFKYNFEYDEDANSGIFILKRGQISEYKSYNPAVLVAPIAAQAGGYLTQLHSYDEAFNNIGLQTDTESNRTYADNLLDLNIEKNLWIHPYSSFETVDLKNAPSVKDNLYGVYFGADSKSYKTENNWNFKYGIYGGYNGARQKYSGNTVRHNGGTLGIVGYWDKEKYVNAFTFSIGADNVKATTMYGKEDFHLYRYGLAYKTGYNWSVYNDKLTIQPNYIISYTSVNASDYVNAARVKIRSRTLHALNMAPGIKIFYDFENGYQPYADLQMVWNIEDRTDFRAQHVALPEMKVKPYAQYGLGIKKTWNDKLSGYGQATFRSMGRSGVDLMAGIKWSFD